MAEYSDRTALLDNLPDEPYKGVLRRILMQAPVADVAPVVHGKWIPAGAICAKCSNCNHLELKSRAKEYIRCPICGAKMDGGDD